MHIYDISQELFSCVVYPGDTKPAMREALRISRGDPYNLTDIALCAHNGTHVDAPFHFLADGKTVEKIPLKKCVGMCYVTTCQGNLTADDAHAILSAARTAHADAWRRILLHGNAVVTAAAATVFAEAGISLIGVESQSVGEAEAPMAVHKILLSEEVVLLEGIRLNDVADGVYLLNAAPLSLGGADGAPCRAILIDNNFLC